MLCIFLLWYIISYIEELIQMPMAKVQHYRGLNTNLDSLYNSIKKEIQDQKELQIISEYKGTLNELPLRSIVAMNNSLKVWAGSLREIHISITGSPNDYAVGGIMAYEFEKHIWKKILEVVKKESEIQPTVDSVEHYHD